MQVTVTVDGYGTYQIDDSKIGELLSWLSNNEATRVKPNPVREVVDNRYTGAELLNE